MPIFPTLLDQFNSNEKIEMFIQSIFELSTRVNHWVKHLVCFDDNGGRTSSRQCVFPNSPTPWHPQCHRATPCWPVPVFYVLIGTTASSSMALFFIFSSSSCMFLDLCRRKRTGKKMVVAQQRENDARRLKNVKS